MEATFGLVYTAQQMAAGAPDCAIVKISPGAQGCSAEMTQPRGLRWGGAPPQACPRRAPCLVVGRQQKGCQRGGFM